MHFSDYRVVAHRGLHDQHHQIPENSIAAFETAIFFQVAIELDIRLTQDEEIIVFHDENLKRMTGIDLTVECSTYQEIKELCLMDTNEHIPLFRQVLRLVNGKVPLLIEIKKEHWTPILEKKMLALLLGYPGKWMIESFHPFALYWFRQNAPQVPRGQLSCCGFPAIHSRIEKFALRHMLFNGVTAPQFVAYQIEDLSVNLSQKLQKQEIGVLGWTIRTDETLVKAAHLCNGVIFEDLPISHVRQVMDNANSFLY